MTTLYVSEAAYKAAVAGPQWKDLPTGTPDELQNYIERASLAIEQFTNRVFAAQASVVETLFTSGAGRAIIQNSGFVLLYPTQGYPINSVASLTWKLRAPNLSNNTPATTPTTVLSGDILIETDAFNEGSRIQVFEDFAAYRSPRIPVQFTLTYASGYSTYPKWLEDAAIHWTAALLLKRGAQAFVMSGAGLPIDPSSGGSHLQYAMDLLQNHVRRN